MPLSTNCADALRDVATAKETRIWFLASPEMCVCFAPEILQI